MGNRSWRAPELLAGVTYTSLDRVYRIGVAYEFNQIGTWFHHGEGTQEEDFDHRITLRRNRYDEVRGRSLAFGSHSSEISNAVNTFLRAPSRLSTTARGIPSHWRHLSASFNLLRVAVLNANR